MFYTIIVNFSYSAIYVFIYWPDVTGFTTPNQFCLRFTTELHSPACHIAAGSVAPCPRAETSRPRPLKCLRATERRICSYKPLHCLHIYDVHIQKGLLMAGFSALATRWSRFLKAIHISDSMERCHGSWQPLTTHLKFSVAAKPSCVPPHLGIIHFFHRCCHENMFVSVRL